MLHLGRLKWFRHIDSEVSLTSSITLPRAQQSVLLHFHSQLRVPPVTCLVPVSDKVVLSKTG